MAKKALGKGLDALFFVQDEDAPQEVTPDEAKDTSYQIQQIDLSMIDPNPDQPRKSFDPEKLEELAESVKEKGLIQPILVEPEGDRFRLVAGERRYRASKMAGLNTIPAVVRAFSDSERLEIALIENIQRDDLTPLEEAHAYAELIEKSGCSQEELAHRVGKKRSTIANSLRLLKLPREMGDAVQDGVISPGHARALLAVSDNAFQKQLFKKIVDEGLSVREAEKEATGLQESAPPSGTRRDSGSFPELMEKKDPEIIRMERELLDKFGTKVSIRGNLDNGKIEISYFSMDDLDRIYEILFPSSDK